MRKKAFIHIGTGKTGTTSIQNSLSSQKQKLAGIGYPNIVGNAHHFLEVIYQDYSRLSRGHRSAYADKSALAKDAKVLKTKFLKRASQNQNIIISSEFLGRMQEPQIQSLKEDLDEAGYTDYQILCYVRDPISYFKSSLQQKMKASHRPINPRIFKYGVRQSIERYRSCYGDNVVVRAYDENLYKGDVVQDFLKLAGKFFKVEFSKVESRNTNRSLSAEAMFILQRYRELYDFEQDNVLTNEADALIDYLMQVPTSGTMPIVLNPEVEIIIRERFQGEIDWLEENYAIRFYDNSCDPKNSRVLRNRNYDLLENIIRKPSDSDIDQIKFDIINKFLGMC